MNDCTCLFGVIVEEDSYSPCLTYIPERKGLIAQDMRGKMSPQQYMLLIQSLHEGHFLSTTLMLHISVGDIDQDRAVEAWITHADPLTLMKASSTGDDVEDLRDVVILLADLLSLENGTPGEITIKEDEFSRTLEVFRFSCQMELMIRRGLIQRLPSDGHILIGDVLYRKTSALIDLSEESRMHIAQSMAVWAQHASRPYQTYKQRDREDGRP